MVPYIRVPQEPADLGSPVIGGPSQFSPLLEEPGFPENKGNWLLLISLVPKEPRFPKNSLNRPVPTGTLGTENKLNRLVLTA